MVERMKSLADRAELGAGVFKDRIWGPHKEIPPLTVAMKLCRRKGRSIRAVIVVEHRNIRYILEALQRRDDPRFCGLLYVLTGGFSDLPTREFLHMLGEDPELEDAQFLFISDRDAHSMEIFADLKYGSMSSAYASRIMVCPRLQWAGLVSICALPFFAV